MTRILPSHPSPQPLTDGMILEQDLEPKSQRASDATIARTPRLSKTEIKEFKPKFKRPARPTYTKMITEAVFENHKWKKGTSLAIIKKHLYNKYGVDVKKFSKRICKCIRECVSEGKVLVQVTGTGANGSFKLNNKTRKRLQSEKNKSLTLPPVKTKMLSGSPRVKRMMVE